MSRIALLTFISYPGSFGSKILKNRPRAPVFFSMAIARKHVNFVAKMKGRIVVRKVFCFCICLTLKKIFYQYLFRKTYNLHFPYLVPKITQIQPASTSPPDPLVLHLCTRYAAQKSYFLSDTVIWAFYDRRVNT